MEDPQPPKQQTIFLGTFEENSNRILSKFKSNKTKTAQNLHGEMFRDTNVMGEPREDWKLDSWINWSKDNVDQESLYAFRQELDQMFQYGSQSQIRYEEYELNQQIVDELNSFSLESYRYNHSQNVIMCIIYSIYTSLAEEKNIQGQQRDQTLWKIGQWKDKNLKIATATTVKNFRVTHYSEVSIPTLASQEKNLNPKNKKLLFPNQPLNNNEKKAQFLAFEHICHQTELFWSNKISYEQYTFAFRKISDDDKIMFASKVALAKLKFPSKVNRLPTNPTDGILPEFADKETVAIVGDWGSGFRDSLDLIDELVLKRRATIIIHLGDVYYAGFSEQFARISQKIKQLRQEVPYLLYYTIPGNHDYYTNGAPFYEHLANCNSKTYVQKFGFFCLRNKSQTIQFIGLDTGRNGSGLLDQVSPLFGGTTVQSEELLWARDRINQFNGQTILLTHHQLFSPYEKIGGTLTKYGLKNPQVNPYLSAQVFDLLPKVTAWFWGHEHRLAGYVKDAYGVNAARLIGNSAFQVHSPQTYDINYRGVNVIDNSFIIGRDKDGWYDHTGAIVKFVDNSLHVQYINMTSSYLQRSKVTHIKKQIINPPKTEFVLANKTYKIVEQTCLSYALYSDYIWLNYVPTEFVLELPNDPTYAGPIADNSLVYIKTKDGQYLYLSFWNYVKVSRNRGDAHAIRVKAKIDKANLEVGDPIIIGSHNKGMWFGRYFYVNYFAVAAGGSTIVAPIKFFPSNQ